MRECDKYIELMQKKLDCELSEIEEKMLAKHLISCPACAADYEAFQEMAQIFEGFQMEEPPIGLKESVMTEILAFQTDKTVITEETPVAQRKKGFSLLIILALVNAVLFLTRIIPLNWFIQNSIDRVAIYQFFTSMFTRYIQVGNLVGKALKLAGGTVFKAIPTSWLVCTFGMTLMLCLCLCGLLLYERRMN